MRVGESNVDFTIDSQAGLPGMIPSLAAATCTLVVKQLTPSAYCEQTSRVVVPTSRLVPNGDGRTFVYTAIATDVPVEGVYELQIIAEFPDGVTVRLSEIGTMIVETSL